MEKNEKAKNDMTKKKNLTSVELFSVVVVLLLHHHRHQQRSFNLFYHAAVCGCLSVIYTHSLSFSLSVYIKHYQEMHTQMTE